MKLTCLVIVQCSLCACVVHVVDSLCMWHKHGWILHDHASVGGYTYRQQMHPLHMLNMIVYGRVTDGTGRGIPGNNTCNLGRIHTGHLTRHIKVDVANVRSHGHFSPPLAFTLAPSLMYLNSRRHLKDVRDSDSELTDVRSATAACSSRRCVAP